jgi:hypothetical protein
MRWEYRRASSLPWETSTMAKIGTAAQIMTVKKKNE